MNLDPPASNAPADCSEGNKFIRNSIQENEANHQLLVPPSCEDNLLESESMESESCDLISAALSELPVDDREKAFDEIHGVLGLPDVSRQFMDSKVLALQEQLRVCTLQQNDHVTRAFALATMQNVEFAYNSTACERFLIASDFDVLKAASAMLSYFDLKFQLWGEKKLGAEIELDDLNETDIEVLKIGYFQVLPERDRAGRQICTVVLKDQKIPSVHCAARVLWYTFQQRLDQPSEFVTVWVFFHLMQPGSKVMDSSMLHMYQKLLTTLPWKRAACHHCLADDSSLHFHTFLGQLLSPLDSANRAKTKVHSGSFNDWVNSLTTYGIPPHIIPINDDGRIRVKNHLEFLQGRKTGEQLLRGGETNVIYLPLNSDILFGRGKPIQQTPGNLRLSAIVDSFVSDYHRRNKQEKTALATQIVEMVKSASGRFLSKNSGIWMVVSDDIAREKVSGLFRTLYRKRFEGEDDKCIDTVENNEVVSRMA